MNEFRDINDIKEKNRDNRTLMRENVELSYQEVTYIIEPQERWVVCLVQ